MTPEGWSRAEILLLTLREPPKVGSLRESVLQRFVLLKAQIEHARMTVAVQATMDPKAAIKAYEQYLKMAFPWEEVETRRTEKSIADFLKSEVARGPLSIKPQGQPDIRSRLAATSAGDRRRSDRVLKKLGKLIDG